MCTVIIMRFVLVTDGVCKVGTYWHIATKYECEYILMRGLVFVISVVYQYRVWACVETQSNMVLGWDWFTIGLRWVTSSVLDCASEKDCVTRNIKD